MPRSTTLSSAFSAQRLVGALALGAVVALHGACASNPASGKREVSLMSEAQEIALGRQGDAEIRRSMGVYADEELQQYVSGVGAKIASVSHRPHLPWTFTLLDSPMVNAFALPGGFVYVTRGLLAHLEDESELAGVLGHEVGHVTARHVSQQYTRSAGGTLGMILVSIFVPSVRPFGDLASAGLGTLFLKYGRDDELESDRLGMEYASEAGWDPAGVPRFLETLTRLDATTARGMPNWLSTHPEPASRVEKARPVAATAAGDRALERHQDDFLRRLDGLTYGDDPAEGVVRGHQFLHPDLRIAVDFPEGWEVQNGTDQVVARLDAEKAMMVMQAADAARGASLSDGATKHMRGLGFKLETGSLEPWGQGESYVGVYQGKSRGVGAVRVRATHVAVGQQVFMLAGVAPTADFARFDAEFGPALRSFRELSRSEAAAVRPNRLSLYVVKTGDSWQSIAQRAGRGIVSASRLALMNGSATNVQPVVGTQLKIVAEG